MWGEPEEAMELDASDDLSLLLFQVASPAHIPWNDPRWQELLHGAEVWVHVEVRDDPQGVLQQACEKMAKNAAQSSNLAAMCVLVCQMLDGLAPSNNANQPVDQVAEFSERIAVVGKARAAAGSLQLLRLLVHRCVVINANQSTVLGEIFTYRNRDTGKNQNVAIELLDSLFHFLTMEKARPKIEQVPEMYDTAVLALQLLTVMLSTQLYQPMLSSFQQMEEQQQQQAAAQFTNTQTDFFLDLILEDARSRAQEGEPNNNNTGGSSNDDKGRKKKRSNPWTPRSLLAACLNWQIQRPRSPDRSIARYHYTLAKSVVAAKGERVGPDGMYESNLVVSAANHNNQHHQRGSTTDRTGESTTSLSASQHNSSFLFDATKGVLVQASTIILLPFRLVSLALGLFHQHSNQKGFEKSRKNQFLRGASSPTRDILWMSDSPVADLCACLFLLLTNNRRADDTANPFRTELAALTDNRWESGHLDASALPDLPALGAEGVPLMGSFDREESSSQQFSSSTTNTGKNHHPALMLNFETLFLSFGAILHTEVGALAMYTILRSSQVFSETLAVRSDLDTLVLPLLRTLYFSSTSRHVSALDYQAKSNKPSSSTEKSLAAHEKHESTKPTTQSTASSSIRTMPFRSPSQLYVIVILLLLFSQDSAFGSDAFRRTMVPTVPWYKERYLKDVNLGSVLLLTLLRSLTFNLNRLHDMFLLGNCCAILMNLSNSVVDLHDYAAMRLASVTVSCLKKYTAMTVEQLNNNSNGENEAAEGDSLFDMYAEVSHTLLRLIKHTLVQKNIERNLAVVYALVYYQADFKKIFSMKHNPFKKSEITRIQSVIKTSAKIIESKSNARTATKALQVLTENIDEIKKAVAEKKKKTEKEDFTYTYEEEADPETFFVPYIWEVVVCTVTASSVEWDKNRIQVFPLLEVEEVPSDVVENANASGNSGAPAAFAADIMDVV